jgi:hypothetical protein
MSYSHWESVHSDHYLPHGESTGGGAVDDRLPHTHSVDMAIDAALRSVPLPDGLLTRLDKFVHAMTDGATDSVDYLGC